ncbi:MAG TPA: SDR family NAD(P)-dependent oxidoreductase [Candidatus Acidoferrales bacterium]|nr:SDR family NAD(P)-dependent oxidoreductase [Candidatus Acidoferrales bacterium]
MDTTNLSGKTALVTGAASGIGKATALAFARRGANLVLCDFNEVGLTTTEQEARGLGREVYTQKVDVAKREQMEAFAAAVHQRVEAVDILMNNAGVGLGAGFLDTSLTDWDWIVGINLMGVVYGCHYFVPKMVQRDRGGHVVNVSSAAGYVGSEALSAYSTTKFAVFGLSEALRQELYRRNIGVTTVCPGIINTPITRTSPMRGLAATAGAQERMIKLYERRNYTPERVAENILKAIQRNRGVAPISPESWVMYYLKRFAPWLVAILNRSMGDRMRKEIAASQHP